MPYHLAGFTVPEFLLEDIISPVHFFQFYHDIQLVFLLRIPVE